MDHVSDQALEARNGSKRLPLVEVKAQQSLPVVAEGGEAENVTRIGEMGESKTLDQTAQDNMSNNDDNSVLSETSLLIDFPLTSKDIFLTHPPLKTSRYKHNK